MTIAQLDLRNPTRRLQRQRRRTRPRRLSSEPVNCNSSPLQPLFASSLSDVKAGFFANVEATKTIPAVPVTPPDPPFHLALIT
ncbi:NADPH-dependent alpha-keto amide [Apiospora arundinis]|uniref:Uncharacterized protein n=1 Tax=Apiospora arundinis TaxID=335852 RepID=A0ABR2J5F8_9PEZI